MKYLIFILIVCFSTQCFSEVKTLISAFRKPTETLEDIIFDRSLKTSKLKRKGSAYSSSTYLEQVDFSHITRWTDLDLTVTFPIIRDERFIESNDSSEFQRRSTWLYPHDGCWARASLASIRSAKMGLKRPNKVFVFGTLEVQTPNSKEGKVSWWYHVVPIVLNEKNIPVVLDPAIEPHYPIYFYEWLKKMGDVSKMQIAICSTYTYSPMDMCEGASPNTESNALIDQKRYLPLEWNNLVDLKRDPNIELGNTPPWLNDSLLIY